MREKGVLFVECGQSNRQKGPGRQACWTDSIDLSSFLHCCYASVGGNVVIGRPKQKIGMPTCIIQCEEDRRLSLFT